MADVTNESKSDVESTRKSTRIQKKSVRVNDALTKLKKNEKRKRSLSENSKEDKTPKKAERDVKNNEKTKVNQELKSTEKSKNSIVLKHKLKGKIKTPTKRNALAAIEHSMTEDEDESNEDDEEENMFSKTDENEPNFVPTMLGLHRVGFELPKKEKREAVMLNRRGVPQRKIKKNRFFYDENVVNPLMPKQRSKKEVVQIKKKEKILPKIKPKIKTDKKEDEKPEEKTVALTITDRKIGQRIGMKLRNLLKLPKAHRWVCHEWFYSNIDKVLFETNDFTICFEESFPQLKTKMLTRIEWCKVRRLLGKPRRCSQAFLDGERHELNRKRNKIRLLQQRKLSDLSTCRDLPDKVPLQLTVGAKVTARLRFPQDGLFTGTVDAVDTSNSTYRITFDRLGLGTHSVPDYEVLSNDKPDFFSLSSITRRYHAIMKNYCNNMSKATVESSKPSFEPKIDLRSMTEKSVLGLYPYKLLEMTVFISKILGVKKTMIKKLKDMNAEAEITISSNKPYKDYFQRRYAGLIIELEVLNRNLGKYLTGVQKFCHEIAPEPSMSALLTPSYLREKSKEEARSLVAKRVQGTYDPAEMPDKSTSDLIVNLIAMMIQIKKLSESDQNAHELLVLQQSMEQIKSSLSQSNLACFRNNVEVHMQFMLNGLGQYSCLTSFQSKKKAIKW